MTSKLKETGLDFTDKVTKAVLEAGKAVLDVYGTDFSVVSKEDSSPLTEADRRSHEILSSVLKVHYPVLSEESDTIPYSTRKNWSTYWLIDPLDGTKEFVKRNGEFTVNVALIENGVPVAGWVYAPVKDLLYMGMQGKGAWRIEKALYGYEIGAVKNPLPLSAGCRPFTIVASRSHLNEATAEYISELEKEHPGAERLSAGSSLKLCMVAEGSADVYPRFAPTMEWDTAAADAVCRAAGCSVLQWSREKKQPDGPLVYNKENLLNPWFIVQRK
jgi:3'(2'), 5'-bisphosphate nucleotidase